MESENSNPSLPAAADSRQPCYPDVMQTTLKMLRKMESPDDSEQIKEFMITTAELPGDCVVQLSAGVARLVVDEKGRLLSFA